MEEKELVTLIQTGLKDLGDRIETSRTEVNFQFEKIDRRFDQIDGRFAQHDGRFDRLESEVRQSHIQLEGLRGEIHQVAEGVANVEEKLERHVVENNQQFDEVRSMIRLSYVPLDKRVTKLELRTEDFDARLNVLDNDRH